EPYAVEDPNDRVGYVDRLAFRPHRSEQSVDDAFSNASRKLERRRAEREQWIERMGWRRQDGPHPEAMGASRDVLEEVSSFRRDLRGALLTVRIQESSEKDRNGLDLASVPRAERPNLRPRKIRVG